MRKLHALTVVAITALLAWPAFADPVIGGLSPAAPARSGRLVITGSGFGSAPGSGSVTIGALVAPVTSWTDTRIVAYVPEASPLGVAGVRVTAGGVPSNVVSAAVAARPPASGHVLWRFQGDALYSLTRGALAHSGGVYAVDVAGTLYSLSPTGGLNWLARGAGGKGVSVGPDGTVYTGDENFIKAWNPDGTARWTFVQNPRAFILLGPNVGPDGNIYAVASSGMGVFSLTPEGQLRWAREEVYDRGIVDYQEVVFGPDGGNGWNLYFHANNHFKGVRLSNGNTVFAIPGGRSQPVVGPDGSIYVGGLARYSPSGSLLNSWVPSPNNGSSGHDVGPDGSVYFAYNLMWYTGLTASLQPRWNFLSDGMVNWPTADPTIPARLVVSSGALQFGMSGYLQAQRPADGALLWREQLPQEIGNNLVGANRATFTPDGRGAYVTVYMFGYNEEDVYWYLYALDTSDGLPPVCRADWNGDGAVNSQDFFDFLASFFGGGADYNGDGSSNSQDFFDFVGAFFVGCP